MNTSIRDSFELFTRITDTSQERNIYAHPNSIARDIFWQRLESLLIGMVSVCGTPSKILDFGGGSGAFLKGLSTEYASSMIDVVDLDPQDAEALRQHHSIANISIFKEDIQKWSPTVLYDVIIATDVLEHFQDLSVPIAAIKRLLKANGFLCISVPTENFLYLAGRVLINKQKPLDHYHAGKDVVAYLKSTGFQSVWTSYAPRYFGFPLPLFQLEILEKHAAVN